MKIIALLGAIVCVLHVVIQVDSASTNDVLDESEQECIIITEIDEDVVIEAKASSTVPADNPKYKIFLSCLWKKYGYQRENGDIDQEKIQEVLANTYKPNIAAQLVKKCEHIKGKTDGDKVALVLLCLDEHAPNIRSVHGYYAGHHDD